MTDIPKNLKDNENSSSSKDGEKLIGNKRERENLKDNNETPKKICSNCKIYTSSELLNFDEPKEPQPLFEYFNNKIKDEEFIKILKQNIDKILANPNSKNEIEINSLCHSCLLSEFIKGGINHIFTKKEKEKNEVLNPQDKNIKKLIDIYSLNLNIAIKSLVELKEKYKNEIKNVNEIFNSFCLQIIFGKNKEAFQEIKKKIDNSAKTLEDIEGNLDLLINNLTMKENMKIFILENISNNDINSKKILMKIIKQLESEIGSTIEETNIEKNNNNKITNKDNSKKNGPEVLVNNNNNNDIFKHNMLLSQPNLIQNPNLINPGLGILPQFGIPNNLLLNNLMLNSTLNPSVLNQINNTINLNSILSSLNNNNNNQNENNKNLNNLNNLQVPGINNLYQHQQPLNLNTGNYLELLSIYRSLLNNNPMQNPIQPINNMMNNNPNNNQLNPNFIPGLSLNNIIPQPSPLISPNLNTLNNLGNNKINNNTLDLNNMNQKDINNEDKNLINMNQNNNNGNINLNNINKINEPVNNNNPNKIMQPNQINQSTKSEIVDLFNIVANNSKKNN